MRRLFIAIAGMIFLTSAGIAQQVVILPIAGIPGTTMAPFAGDTINIPASELNDSASSVINEPVNIKKASQSVYDIYWLTNSLKCGWKTADTAMIGTGLEPCDTAHPFIMPVVGKLWRGCTYYHAGWDIGLKYGDPVVAGLNGRVRFAKYCSGYGNLVIVRHYSGMEVYYAHLSKLKVKPDQWVEAGDTIGLGGATGHARGNHLHMEFRVCDKALDVADYLVQNDTVVNLYKIKEFAAVQKQLMSAEYYTVVRGDNLSQIASHYGTTVTNLCTLNNIGRTSILRIGQRLRIR
jgi:LysM repeat protein